MTILAAFIAYRGYRFYNAFQDHSGRDLSSHPCVPARARHIYFHDMFGYHALVFDIDEADFKAWAAGYGYVDYPVFPRARNHARCRIDDGLIIAADIENGIMIQNDSVGGGGYIVQYDRKTQRAYYEYTMQ